MIVELRQAVRVRQLAQALGLAALVFERVLQARQSGVAVTLGRERHVECGDLYDELDEIVVCVRVLLQSSRYRADQELLQVAERALVQAVRDTHALVHPADVETIIEILAGAVVDTETQQVLRHRRLELVQRCNIAGDLSKFINGGEPGVEAVDDLIDIRADHTRLQEGAGASARRIIETQQGETFSPRRIVHPALARHRNSHGDATHPKDPKR